MIEILQKKVVPHLTLSATRVELAMLGALRWTVVRTATKAAVEGAVQVVARVALGGVMKGVEQAGIRAASTLSIGVGVVFVAWELINLSYTIKDVVHGKGSDAAGCLRQRANELENAILVSSKD